MTLRKFKVTIVHTQVSDVYINVIDRVDGAVMSIAEAQAKVEYLISEAFDGLDHPSFYGPHLESHVSYLTTEIFIFNKGTLEVPDEPVKE